MQATTKARRDTTKARRDTAKARHEVKRLLLVLDVVPLLEALQLCFALSQVLLCGLSRRHVIEDCGQSTLQTRAFVSRQYTSQPWITNTTASRILTNNIPLVEMVPVQAFERPLGIDKLLKDDKGGPLCLAVHAQSDLAKRSVLAEEVVQVVARGGEVDVFDKKDSRLRPVAFGDGHLASSFKRRRLCVSRESQV